MLQHVSSEDKSSSRSRKLISVLHLFICSNEGKFDNWLLLKVIFFCVAVQLFGHLKHEDLKMLLLLQIQLRLSQNSS